MRPYAMLISACLGCLSAGPAYALDFAQAYDAAVQADARLRAAQAALSAGLEQVPQAQSQWRPQASWSMSRARNELRTVGESSLGLTSVTRDRYYSYSKQLSIKQALINRALDAGLTLAQRQEDEARARFDAAALDLVERLGTLYLGVLLAKQQVQLLRVEQEQQQALLQAAQNLFAAGNGTRTDIDEAQASFDMTVARALEAQQALDLARHELSAVVGMDVGELQEVAVDAFLAMPAVELTLSEWMTRAHQASPELRAAQARAAAASASLQRAQAGHWPTLDAVVQWSDTGSENVTSVSSEYQRSSISLQFNLPLYQGGYVDSRVRQTEAERVQAAAEQEALQRDIDLRVHREYRRVTEGELRIRALEQAQASAQRALESARRSQEAGLRSVIDVLNAQQRAAGAERDIARARYDYLLARLRLQVLAGESINDIIADLNQSLAAASHSPEASEVRRPLASPALGDALQAPRAEVRVGVEPITPALW